MLSAVAGAARWRAETQAFRTAARVSIVPWGLPRRDARRCIRRWLRAGRLSDALSGRSYANADAFKVIGMIAGEATAPALHRLRRVWAERS